MSKKRYIVLLDNSTPAQDVAFLNWIKEIDLGWWHWLSNSWLLYDTANKTDSDAIRDKVKEAYPGIHNLVLEFSGTEDTWSGWGPSNSTEDKSNMFKWIRDNWSKE